MGRVGDGFGMIPDMVPPTMHPYGMQGEEYDPKLPGQCLIVGAIAIVFSLMFVLLFFSCGFSVLGGIVYIVASLGALSGFLAIITSIIGILFSATTLKKVSLFGNETHRTKAKIALFLSIGAGGGTILLIGALITFLYGTGFF